MQLIKVGQIIGNKTKGNAVVCSIHGVQGEPARIIREDGVLNTAPIATFDVIFYDGTRFRKVSECALRAKTAWYITETIVSQKEIIKLISLANEKEEKEKAEIEKVNNEFNSEVSRLKTSEEHADLIQSDEPYSEKLAAKNIRIELKKQFKGVKFSVRKTQYDSLYISWIDGPKKDDVKNICSKYKTGRFDSYSDYHYSDSSPFNKVFGGVSYLFLDRSLSDEFINEGIGILLDKYELQLEGKVKPTVEDYRTGRLYNQGLTFCTRNLQDELREILSEM